MAQLETPTNKNAVILHCINDVMSLLHTHALLSLRADFILWLCPFSLVSVIHFGL